MNADAHPYGTLPACCMDFDIALEHLAFPRRMPAAGLEFVDAHGIWDLSLNDVLAEAEDKGVVEGRHTIRIKHRCQHLTDLGQCDIYATRPAICRDWPCSKRNDCACGGNGPHPGGGLIQIALP